MPHSSLAPPQRPDRRSAPSNGTLVHGSQPMLVKPSSYNARYSISCSTVYFQTLFQSQAARGLAFSKCLPLGRTWFSTVFRFFLVGDCSLRNPVNHRSNGSSALINGSTLRRWQHSPGLLRYRIPKSNSCLATDCVGMTLTRFKPHN